MQNREREREAKREIYDERDCVICLLYFIMHLLLTITANRWTELETELIDFWNSGNVEIGFIQCIWDDVKLFIFCDKQEN